ncbi:MAG: hypothetical protein QNK36_10525 [Colwellia sp.]|nr:hypothetical protein [Colwellia sp.]
MHDELSSTDPATDSIEPTTAESSWNWDDNTAGTGDRPDYLASKFKSVADAAKSYNQLEKKLGSAPKEYSFDIAKEWLDPSFEPLQEAAQFARDKHVSQDVIDNLLGAATLALQEGKIDNKAEIEKLGSDGQERLDVLNNWAKSNFTEKTFDVLLQNMDTAESIIAIEEIRSMLVGGNTMVPGNNDSVSAGVPTVGDIQQEMLDNLAKYKTNPGYRKEIQQKIERASASSSSMFVDK